MPTIQKNTVSHQQSFQEYPTVWHEKYSADDKEKVKQILDWLNAGQDHIPGVHNQRSKRRLARASGVNEQTANGVLRGKYPSPATKFIEKMLDSIRRWDLREEEGIHDCPFVETSVYQMSVAACKRAHLYRMIGVVSAAVGTGKTRSLKHYASKNSNVLMVEGMPGMNSSVFLDELVAMTRAQVKVTYRYSRGTKAERLAAVIRALKGTDSLLILDEADTVIVETLEYFRRICDKAHIGGVLAGTKSLQPMIRDKDGRFGQVSSRVNFWPAIIDGITKDDSILLAQAALLDDDVELTDDVLDAFWQMCDGSARVLVGSLIPGVRDYGLKKKKLLTPDLIFKVGQDLLGFKKSTRRA